MSRIGRIVLIAGLLAVPYAPARIAGGAIVVTPTAVAFNPTFLAGGDATTFEVTLSAPAPSGLSLTLATSSLPEFSTTLTMVSSYSVPVGATKVSVPATSAAVTTTATIMGVVTLNGVSRSAQLTVYPRSTALVAPTLVSPKAGAKLKVRSNVTFDWANVAGATSYWIMIDDTPTFHTSLTLTSSPAASQYFWGTPSYYDMNAGSTSVDRYWRVAARDANGRFGPWSEIRKFTVTR